MKFKVGDKVTSRNLNHSVFSYGVVDRIQWIEETPMFHAAWFYKYQDTSASGTVAYFEEELVFYDEFKEAIYNALQV